MKLNRNNPLLLAAISMVGIGLTFPHALATPYYWDIDAATAGSGGASPSGIWESDVTTWSTDSTGSLATTAYTTLATDDLFFSAGTDASGSYIIDLTTAQDVKSLTFEEGTTTLSGVGTITLAGGGGITVAAGAGNPVISTNLTINGGQTVRVDTGRTLTLNTGTFTRGTRAALNIQGAGTVAYFMAGITTLTNDILGPWASIGTGTSTKYATTSGDNITALTGTPAATAANITSTAGTFNYDVAAVGTLGANANINTLRYAGAAGTIAGGLTTKGIMNTGTGLLTFSGAVTAGAAGTEMVVHTANADIAMTGASALFTGTLNKTGPGTFTLGSGANHSIGNITVNEGVVVTGRNAADGLPGVTINSGGTLRFGNTNKHSNTAITTVNSGGTFDVATFNDTIGGITGAGSVTGTTGYLQFARTATFSGVVSGGMGLRTNDASANITLSGANTYTGNTQANSGVLTATKSAALSGYDVPGKVIFNGGTIGAQIGGNGWTTGEVDTLLSNATKTSGFLGIDTTHGDLTQWTAFTTTNFGPALGLTKLGANILTLNQANTYTGNTRIIAGRIALGNALALQNSAFDTASVTDGLDVTGFATPTLGGLTGSVNLSESMIAGYSGISNLTLNPQAGMTQTYFGDVSDGSGGMILTKSGAGTQALSGFNSYSGGTFVTAGSLVFRTTNAKPSGTHAFGAGATLGLGVANWGAPFFESTDVDNAFTGNMVDNLSNVTVTATTNVGIDTTAGDFTYSTSVAGSPTKGLTKLGVNTLTLTGTNTYTGTTDIQAGTLRIGDSDTTGTLGAGSVTNAGTLVFNRTDAYTLTTGNLVTGAGAVVLANTGSIASTVDNQFNTTGALIIGSANGTPAVSALDLTHGSSSFGSMLVRTDSATANTISIGSGKTLKLNGAVTVGYNSTTNSVTNLAVTGLGTLSIGTNALATNANVQIGNGATTNISNQGIVDLSGLSSFYANLGTGTFRIGSPTNQGSISLGGSTIILAANSTIQAAALSLAGWDATAGPAANSVVQSLKLGSGTNVILVDNLNVGGNGGIINADGRSNGSLTFNEATGTLKVRSQTDTVNGRATLNLGTISHNTAVSSALHLFDTSGHHADLRFGTMTIGTRTSQSGAGSNITAEFKFDQGTLDADNLLAGFRNNGSTATGIVNLGGGTVVVNNLTGPIQLGKNDAGVSTATGILRISGTAEVTVAANAGASIRLGNAAALGGTATGIVNLTGGTLTVAGDIIRGATAGTSNATITLDGGTLDMGGNDIGAADSGAVTLTAESGTLKNVASINGNGGLTKTTAGTLTLSGAITYSGDTTVSEGTLTLSNAASSANANPGNDNSTVTIADTGATLNLTYTGTDRVAKLVIGTTEQAAGVYGKIGSASPIIGIPQITGNGTLTIGAGFSSWITGTFAGGSTVPADKQGPNDDPDNDGIRNLIEYGVAGQDPTVTNPTIGTFNGTTLSFAKRGDASGLTYAIQDSTDLGINDPWGEVTGVPPVYINDGTTISYTLTPGAPPRNFIRLQILSN